LVKDSGYDLKACLNVICNTKAYQSASTKEEIFPGTEYHFTGPVRRRMSAEQMWDSIIGLISPAPDVPSPHTNFTLTDRIARSGKVAAALDGLTPREAYQAGVLVAESYRAAADFAEKGRNQIDALRAKHDDAAADQMAKDVMN